MVNARFVGKMITSKLEIDIESFENLSNALGRSREDLMNSMKQIENLCTGVSKEQSDKVKEFF